MKKILKVLENQKTKIPPIWMMRQAGRYLPEYLKLKDKVPNFLDRCYNPEIAAEITLQPIKRFELDAAIFFSDILVIPDALGIKVEFIPNTGPVLSPLNAEKIKSLKTNLNIKEVLDKLYPCFKTLELVKKELNPNTALIGFCGAPWTVATYMIEGRASKTYEKTKLFFLKHPKEAQILIDILVEVSTQYLLKQIEFGAEILQIFDSWCSCLDPEMFYNFCILPTKKIVENIKQLYPNIPIIGFPRKAGFLYFDYLKHVKVNAVSLDYTIPYEIGQNIQKITPIQGSLDPVKLVFGGEILENEVKSILKNYNKAPFIFNLGHGILPNTPLEHVYNMIDIIKNYKIEN